MMRITGHTLGTPHCNVPEALELFRSIGLDGAEVIYQNDYRSGLPVGDLAAVKSARQTADQLDLPILGLTPYTTAHNSLNNQEWTAAVDELRGAIEAAELLGAKVIRIYAGSWHPGDEDFEGHWAQLTKALSVLASEAADAGATLCVENHFGTMTQTAAATARLVREVGHEAVRVLYDQANLTFTHDEDFEQAFQVQGDLISHVHVKDLVFTDPDAPFRAAETARVQASERAVKSRVVGEGSLPWTDIVGELAKRGYDGLLSLEYEYRWHPQDLPEPREGLARSLEHLKTLINKQTEAQR
ncbi:sugar phosphate isomerase/epimerase [Luteococcus sp. H138]|uniref:sugar phosphate isomerase/epimerase family protein n=1 Tax=unclassified Luteococcus TaxID=2639923 RepID=UPI00313AD322